MTGSRPVNEHDALLEAFRAGWQAGLGVTVKSPGALAVIEGCFEMWLEEAADEVELFGWSSAAAKTCRVPPGCRCAPENGCPLHPRSRHRSSRASRTAARSRGCCAARVLEPDAGVPATP